MLANLLAAPPILFHNPQIVPALIPKGDRTGDSSLSPAKGDKIRRAESLAGIGFRVHLGRLAQLVRALR